VGATRAADRAAIEAAAEVCDDPEGIAGKTPDEQNAPDV
jgi:hypothetical protein